jgi:predicted RNase H-like nuclease (RuvC/YqgF family)
MTESSLNALLYRLSDLAAEVSRLESENESLRAEAAQTTAKAEELQDKINRATKILSPASRHQEVRRRRKAMKVMRKDAMLGSA